MQSRTLTQFETARWETHESFRKAVRFGLNCDYTIPGTYIEVYSFDGITLDAWVVE